MTKQAVLVDPSATRNAILHRRTTVGNVCRTCAKHYVCIVYARGRKLMRLSSHGSRYSYTCTNIYLISLCVSLSLSSYASPQAVRTPTNDTKHDEFAHHVFPAKFSFLQNSLRSSTCLACIRETFLCLTLVPGKLGASSAMLLYPAVLRIFVKSIRRPFRE